MISVPRDGMRAYPITVEGLRNAGYGRHFDPSCEEAN